MTKTEERLLTPTEIGDVLDLEQDGTYPCSDGSKTITVSVDRVVQLQDAKSIREYQKELAERMGAAKKENPFKKETQYADWCAWDWGFEEARQAMIQVVVDLAKEYGIVEEE